MPDEMPGSPPPAAPDPQDHEEAFDAIARILRVLGQWGFDTARTPAEEARADLEAWARHVLVGADPPGSSGAAAGSRDWTGLCRHVSDKRRDEVDFVLQTGVDLRSALWSFIQGMARAIPADRMANGRLTRQLDKLRASLDSKETGEIRRLAAESIEIIGGEIRQRAERDRHWVEAISEHVRRIANELAAAREGLDRDELTGLYSRAAFDAYADRAAQLGMLSGRSHTLLLVDVDDFQWVNERRGEKAADAVLKEVGRELTAGFARRSDFVARFGGDEFAVLFLSEGDPIDLQVGEEAVQRARDLSIPDGDDELRVTLSIGGARLHCGESFEQWLARAEAALESAKDAGHDRLVFAPDVEAGFR